MPTTVTAMTHIHDNVKRDNKGNNNSLNVPPPQTHQPQQSQHLQQQMKKEEEEEEEEEPAEVTLEDVFDNVRHHDRWIQASCNVKPDKKDHTSIILETFQNKRCIILTARSAHDRQMFLNLVRLINSPLRRRDLNMGRQKLVIDKNNM